MDSLKQSLINSLLRIIIITNNHTNLELNKELFALKNIMHDCETIDMLIQHVGVEHKVDITLVNSDLNVIYELVIDKATHKFTIRFDTTSFELLEDNITYTNYYACSSGC